MQYFKSYKKEDVVALTRLRRFETKLGERVEVATQLSETYLAQAAAKFVVFG
ncbi:MAG: arginase, partial [Bacteroidetes bacterium]|nr:arginase [Bacteroidota bacterium]